MRSMVVGGDPGIGAVPGWPTYLTAESDETSHYEGWLTFHRFQNRRSVEIRVTLHSGGAYRRMVYKR